MTPPITWWFTADPRGRYDARAGEVAEWSNAAVLKTVDR